jgi:hypothetical protein
MPGYEWVCKLCGAAAAFRARAAGLVHVAGFLQQSHVPVPACMCIIGSVNFKVSVSRTPVWLIPSSQTYCWSAIIKACVARVVSYVYYRWCVCVCVHRVREGGCMFVLLRIILSGCALSTVFMYESLVIEGL